MGGFAMPVANNSGMTPPNLYAGGTNSTGMQMPVGSTGPGMKNQLLPSTGQTASSPAMPVSAPNGLSVSMNPSTGTSSSTGGVAPVSGATSTGASGSTAQVNPNNLGTLANIGAGEAQSVENENERYLGPGTGALATNYLATGAGYNGALAQQTVSATDNAMQQQINQQYGSLQTSLADAGMSPDSSASALASSEFLSNASAQENEVASTQYTNMYSQSQQDYLSELQSLQAINNAGTMSQTTALGDISSLLTGGVTGLAQYNSGAGGTAGTVTSGASSSSAGLMSALGGLF